MLDGRGDSAGWDGGPEPGRWYRPTTSRGKLILLVTVTVVLLVSLVGCCAAAATLADLWAIDPFGLPLLRSVWARGL